MRAPSKSGEIASVKWCQGQFQRRGVRPTGVTCANLPTRAATQEQNRRTFPDSTKGSNKRGQVHFLAGKRKNEPDPFSRFIFFLGKGKMNPTPFLLEEIQIREGQDLLLRYQ